MSILKSILHHWNKTTSSYDTLHPETEVAQITDWSQGIVNTLASTALGSLISTLSSDSLMAKLMKLVLDATGVKYLMGTNGYICFGSLFGGLIIQWGFYTKIIENFNPDIISNTTLYTNYVQISYPVAITKPLAVFSSVGGGNYQNQAFVGAETSTANLMSENALTEFSLSVSGRLNDTVGVHWAMVGVA